MPTYQYECRACGKVFEAVQRMTEDALTECVACKGAVRRLIGLGSGFIIKGGSKSSSSGSSCAGCTSSACSTCRK